MARDQVSTIICCQFAKAVEDKIAGAGFGNPAWALSSITMIHFAGAAEKIKVSRVMEKTKIINKVNRLKPGDFSGQIVQINRIDRG